MIGRKKIIGQGIGLEDAEDDAFERLNWFVLASGYKIVNVSTKDIRTNGVYWCEIDLVYEYNDEE